MRIKKKTFVKILKYMILILRITHLFFHFVLGV